MADSGYMVNTSQGVRGPFSPRELKELMDSGKLPPEAKVRDATSGVYVTASQALAGHQAMAKVATGTADLELLGAAPAVGDQSGSYRKGGTARLRKGPGRGGRNRGTSEGGTDPRTARTSRRGRGPRGSGPGKWILLIMVVTLVIGVIVAVVLLRKS